MGTARTLTEQAAKAWGQVEPSASEEMHRPGLPQVFSINVCPSIESYSWDNKGKSCDVLGTS